MGLRHPQEVYDKSITDNGAFSNELQSELNVLIDKMGLKHAVLFGTKDDKPNAVVFSKKCPYGIVALVSDILNGLRLDMCDRNRETLN